MECKELDQANKRLAKQYEKIVSANQKIDELVQELKERHNAAQMLKRQRDRARVVRDKYLAERDEALAELNETLATLEKVESEVIEWRKGG